ncbi:peptide transporter family 1-like isoform X2 [Sitodiplosis mosellana]|uniref:peptide transporter family 1-like isoform X2 n=1 Tax=Sitodiplosis mosellana TaxID=263140 RepID=UPI00244392C1|nr:peptide transporter family 1-like isoform X2 [Sitodiplosis mosellana]XP_055305333.1 peptide transporter family 1-like isoform X2 [Sitodiplosis mosellana]
MKLKYPKSVAFIICNEFCERFNYYGMRTVLVLYLTGKLAYSNDDATVLFHVFASLAYFFPLIGAIIADSWLGRFKTIVYLSMIYALGTVVLTLGAVPTLNLPTNQVTVLGLLLIAMGTGGIKPNVSAFGGDQFKLPEQAKHLATFFSLFYLSINLGSMISTLLTPILRENVHCFGELSCYSLAFGVPGALMVISILIYVIGKPFYVLIPPSGNIIVKIGKCIVQAYKTRSKERLTKPRYHFLDYAEPKYGKQLVYDVKCLAKILVLYIPFPLFWALFDQQSSRWTFQAAQMDGFISQQYSIKPDQMQVMNPLIVVFCIPLFNFVIYPMLGKVKINTPLRKMALGMTLCGLAFAMSGFLELQLEKTYPVMPKAGEGQLRIFNGQSCGFQLQTNLPSHEKIYLAPNSAWSERHITFKENEPSKTIQYNITTEPGSTCEPISFNGDLKIFPEKATTYLLAATNAFVQYEDSLARSKSTLPLLRILITSWVNSSDVISKEIMIQNMLNAHSYKLHSDLNKLHEVEVGSYFVWVDGIQVGGFELKHNAAYSAVITQISQYNYTMTVHTITEPPSLHILWQIPQYVIVTAGEIMFSVTGLEFSFTQAPSSMKSVLQAFWLLTVTFGNIFVVIIAKIKVFDTQSGEFFLFAGLMALNIILFIFLAKRYKYRAVIEDIENDEAATRNANIINMNSTPALNETFVVDGFGPTAVATSQSNPRSSLSNGSNASEKLDSSPKCLKRNSNGKNGVDKYGYTDI